MLVQAGFEVAHPLVELGELVLEQRVALLHDLECDQSAPNQRLDGGRGGRPIGGADPSWRPSVIHRKSMHTACPTVNHPCGQSVGGVVNDYEEALIDNSLAGSLPLGC